MKIQESGENYLETILVLQEKSNVVRAIDVAAALQFSKASVSRAVGILKAAGLVAMGRGGGLVLTAEGRARAEAVYERHRFIAQFFEQTLGVPHETALSDACRIEHVISEESFGRIKTYVKEHIS